MDTVPHSDLEDNLLPKTSGVYKITCIANGKIYIGSAVNLRYRKTQHFSKLQRNKHYNSPLQNAWNKYGEQAFIYEILELVLPMSLTAREQYWLNKLKPFGKKGFNIVPVAGSTLGRKLSSETKEKIGNASRGKKFSPERNERLRQVGLGRKHTPQSIEKMRQAHLGRKDSPETIEKRRQSQIGKKLSPEHIEKLRQSKLGNTAWIGRKRDERGKFA